MLGRAAAEAQRRVGRQGVGIELCAQVGQLRRLVVEGRGGRGATQRQGMAQLFMQRFLVGFVAVQLQAGRAQAQRIEAALYHFQSRHLFGHEQYFLPGPNGFGQQVGNGLRLAGAGRPLYHQVAAFLHGQERQQLRRIGIQYLVQLGGGAFRVQKGVFAHARRGILKPGFGPQQRPNGWMLQQGRCTIGRRWPESRVQVAVQHQLAEREEAQGDAIGFYCPTGAARYGFAHGGEVVAQGLFFQVRQWQLNAEIGLEPRL